MYHILQIEDSKIDSKVRREWKMQGIPISGAVKEIHIHDAIKEGKETGLEEGRLQLVRSMPDDGFRQKPFRNIRVPIIPW